MPRQVDIPLDEAPLWASLRARYILILSTCQAAASYEELADRLIDAVRTAASEWDEELE
jgi:hypothetical protein